jgi:hypothetical protein
MLNENKKQLKGRMYSENERDVIKNRNRKIITFVT